MGGGRKSEAGRIEAARKGDQEACSELYRRHRDYVLRLAARFGVADAEAEDLLQEAFIIFFRKMPSFESRAKVSTWLYPTVRFLALKRRRGLLRWLPLGDRELTMSAPAREPLRDGVRNVVDMVAALPADQREILLLRFVDEMSLKEIAAALSRPLGTCKARRFYALEALRNEGGAAR